MENANAALIMLTAAIFFALIIERILEVTKCIYDYIEAKKDFSDFWNRRAISIRERLHNRLKKSKDNKLQQTVFKYLASRYVNADHPGYEGALVISANKLRTFAVKGVVKSVGAILGIVVAFGVGINVFALISQWTDTSNTMSLKLFEVHLPEWLQYSITGIIMGLGSGPIHKFITALERARRNRKSTDVV
jgi:hypothetical protein